jgi:hypothetical protein
MKITYLSKASFHQNVLIGLTLKNKLLLYLLLLKMVNYPFKLNFYNKNYNHIYKYYLYN